MQAVNGFNKGKGFACTGFHQHINGQGGRGRVMHQHRACGHAIALANLKDVVAQGCSGFARGHHRVALCVGWGYKAHIGKYLGNALHCLGLVGKGGVLEFSDHEWLGMGRGCRVDCQLKFHVSYQAINRQAV